MFIAPLMMCIMGAGVGLMTTGETRTGYLHALRGGLLFALAPIAAAAILIVAFRLVRRLVRGPRRRS